MPLPIPPEFARTTHEVFGEDGRAWLEGLPAAVDALARRWSFTPGHPFALSYNYVLRGWRAGGQPVVFKIGVPRPEITREIEALRCYDGRGICRLLEADVEAGAMLLEALRPGTMLAELDDDELATAIGAGVMQGLFRPLPKEHPFVPVETWAADLEAIPRFPGGTPLPAGLVDRARGLFAELFASAAPPVLIHGDLHHFNILAAGREPWLAIDPKGMAGEPAYEVGAFLRNPFPAFPARPDAGRLLARRVDQFAERLDLDRGRLIGYGIAQAVLSAWWSVEDHGRGWEPAIRIAELLAEL